MSPRHAIRRKLNRALLVMATCVLAFAAVSVGVSSVPPWIGLPLFVVFMGAGLYTNWLIDCPLCHVVYGRNVVNVAYPRLIPGNPRACPSCGRDLDKAQNEA